MMALKWVRAFLGRILVGEMMRMTPSFGVRRLAPCIKGLASSW